ncbi:MAG: urea ABC transporter permease subunit UrtB [Acidimicrobiia bacterium]
MSTLLNQLFIGLSQASVLLLIALGLTFTFGQMGVINMAHGEFIMAGAYTPHVLQGMALFAGMGGLAFVVSVPVAFVVAGTLGVALERLLLRRMYGRPLDTLLVTFGVSLILQQFAKDRFGAQPVDVETPTWLRGNWKVLGVTMTHTRLFIIVLVLAVMGIVNVFMNRMKQGRRMRAVTQHRDLAAVSGLHTRRVDGATFFLGSGLAGIAGVAIALIGSVGFNIGTSYIVDAFLVVIVGGLGKLRGAVIAAVALGVVNSYIEYETSATMGKALVFVLVILFLQFRPNGIVSFRTRGVAA